MSKIEVKNLSRAGKGRPKGCANVIPGCVKVAAIEAATLAGGDEGLVGYLTTQATKQPVQFLALLGRVLPLQVVPPGEASLAITFETV